MFKVISIIFIIILLSFSSFSSSIVIPSSPSFNEHFMIYSDATNGKVGWYLTKKDGETYAKLDDKYLPENTIKKGNIYISKLKKGKNGSYIIFKGIPASCEGIYIGYKIISNSGKSSGKMIIISPYNIKSRKLKFNVALNSYHRNFSESFYAFYKDDVLDSNLKIGVDYTDSASDIKPISIAFSVADNNGELINISSLKSKNDIINSDKTALLKKLTKVRKPIKVINDNKELNINSYFAKIGVLSRLPKDAAMFVFTIRYSNKTKTKMISLMLNDVHFNSDSIKDEADRLNNREIIPD